MWPHGNLICIRKMKSDLGSLVIIIIYPYLFPFFDTTAAHHPLIPFPCLDHIILICFVICYDFRFSKT